MGLLLLLRSFLQSFLFHQQVVYLAPAALTLLVSINPSITGTVLVCTAESLLQLCPKMCDGFVCLLVFLIESQIKTRPSGNVLLLYEVKKAVGLGSSEAGRGFSASD